MATIGPANAPDPGTVRHASTRYDAFISYSHADRQVAVGVERGLHRIGRRMVSLRALPTPVEGVNSSRFDPFPPSLRSTALSP